MPAKQRHNCFVRRDPSDTWQACTRKTAEVLAQAGYEVIYPGRGPNGGAEAEIRRRARKQTQEKLKSTLRRFPGRTPRRLRPDGKSEPGYRAPE